MKQSVQFGSKKIPYTLVFSNRKTLGITVTPNMEVLVKAPLNSEIDRINKKVKKKAPWILNQMDHFLSFYPKTTPRKYISGETHLYFGRNYKLKIIKEDIKNKVESREVYFDRGEIFVYANNSKHAEIKLKNWYREKAVEKIKPLAKSMFKKFVIKHKAPVNKFQFSLRNMPTRWGSCTPKGRIILNPELIKAPKACIEYVIVHELCHLIYQDHTKKFIELQTKEMPDWRKWKNKLENLLA